MRWLTLLLGLTLMPSPSVPPPLRVRTPDGTFNQIPVFELEVSGGTLQKVSPIRTRLIIDSGAGGTGAPTDAEYVTYVPNATLSAERVLAAGSSITLLNSGTSLFINALTGGGGTTVYAATGNQYIVAAAAGDLTAERVLFAGTMIKIDTATAGQVIISQTGRTVRVPMALLTVQPDSANAYWVAQTGANVDVAHVRFVDGGDGIATWWGVVPFNVAPQPLWTLHTYSIGGSATAATTAVFSTFAKAVAHGEDIDSEAYTLLSSAFAASLFRSTTLTVTATSGGNYDGVVAVSAGDYLLVELVRHGADAADTVSDFWDVKALTAQFDIL